MSLLAPNLSLVTTVLNLKGLTTNPGFYITVFQCFFLSSLLLCHSKSPFSHPNDTILSPLFCLQGSHPAKPVLALLRIIHIQFILHDQDHIHSLHKVPTSPGCSTQSHSGLLQCFSVSAITINDTGPEALN